MSMFIRCCVCVLFCLFAFFFPLSLLTHPVLLELLLLVSVVWDPFFVCEVFHMCGYLCWPVGCLRLFSGVSVICLSVFYA